MCLAFFLLTFSLSYALSCTCGARLPNPNKGLKETKEAAIQFSLDEKQANKDLVEFTREEHIFGSFRQTEIARYLQRRIKAEGSTAIIDNFSAEVPNPKALNKNSFAKTTFKAKGRNVIAINNITQDAPCVVALASHYDTKRIEGFRYVGANDSGSSSSLLLQLVRALRKNRTDIKPVCDVIGIWFDGEESYLDNWDDGKTKHPAKITDNTYGSRHLAESLVNCEFLSKRAKCLPEHLGGKPLIALVLMDMIGSRNIVFSKDGNSSGLFLSQAEKSLKLLELKTSFTKTSKSIKDDHIPFKEAGISVFNLIDFTNLTHWHRPGDEISNTSFKSMGLAGKVSFFLAINAAFNPKVFLEYSD